MVFLTFLLIWLVADLNPKLLEISQILKKTDSSFKWTVLSRNERFGWGKTIGSSNFVQITANSVQEPSPVSSKDRKPSSDDSLPIRYSLIQTPVHFGSRPSIFGRTIRFRWSS